MPVKKNPQPTPPKNTIWKIKRKSDGLFSTCSGSYPKFSKEGRCFVSERRLIVHLNMVNKYLSQQKRYRNKQAVHPYLGCEIVQFKITEEVAIPFEEYGQ